MPTPLGVHMGNAGTIGDIGACMQLTPRSDGSKKDNTQITSPLSIELNINNNNDGIGPTFTDEVVITTGSGAQKKVLAVIDVHGNMKIAGKLLQEQNITVTSL